MSAVTVKLRPPPQRAKVLAFIQAEIGAGRAFPTCRAIADQMGWNSSSVPDVLHGLTMDGHIRRLGREKTGYKRVIWGLVE